MIIAAAFQRFETVVTISPMFLILPQFFSGFLVTLDQIPKWLYWLTYPSFIRYAYQALMLVKTALPYYLID